MGQSPTVTKSSGMCSDIDKGLQESSRRHLLDKEDQVKRAIIYDQLLKEARTMYMSLA